MSARSDILLWAQRVIAMKAGPAHLLLELKPDATLEDAQNAFHKIARTAHPDLHRNNLAPDELELVTQAYSHAAAAYQTYRAQSMATQRMKPIKDEATATPGVPGPPPGGGLGASGQMTSKALVHYRKAELALRRGELPAAILHLKMAIAADPGSTFLRTALGEVETEVRKGG